MNKQNSNSHKTGDQKWKKKTYDDKMVIVFVSKNNTENNIHKETSSNIHWSGKILLEQENTLSCKKL